MLSNSAEDLTLKGGNIYSPKKPLPAHCVIPVESCSFDVDNSRSLHHDKNYSHNDSKYFQGKYPPSTYLDYPEDVKYEISNVLESKYDSRNEINNIQKINKDIQPMKFSGQISEHPSHAHIVKGCWTPTTTRRGMRLDSNGIPVKKNGKLYKTKGYVYEKARAYYEKRMALETPEEKAVRLEKARMRYHRKKEEQMHCQGVSYGPRSYGRMAIRISPTCQQLPTPTIESDYDKVNSVRVMHTVSQNGLTSASCDSRQSTYNLTPSVHPPPPPPSYALGQEQSHNGSTSDRNDLDNVRSPWLRNPYDEDRNVFGSGNRVAGGDGAQFVAQLARLARLKAVLEHGQVSVPEKSFSYNADLQSFHDGSFAK